MLGIGGMQAADNFGWYPSEHDVVWKGTSNHTACGHCTLPYPGVCEKSRSGADPCASAHHNGSRSPSSRPPARRPHGVGADNEEHLGAMSQRSPITIAPLALEMNLLPVPTQVPAPMDRFLP